MHSSPPSDKSRFDDLFVTALRRVRNDFLEMPGLQLTPVQGARLWTFDLELCRDVFEALVATRFLTRTRGSTFARMP
jgi:hypothetical protein